MNKFKAIHRFVGIIIAIFLLYLSITGLMIQSIDLHMISTHAPLTDPDILSALENRGGGEYQVLSAADNTAQALPNNVDLNTMLQKVVQSARSSLGDTPLRYVELRMVNGKLVGKVHANETIVSFDGQSGVMLGQEPVPPRVNVSPESSLRYQIKAYHRLTVFGTYSLFINVIVGLGLIAMLGTGVTIYFKLKGERKRNGQSGFFWVGGNGSISDWKRAMHRWVAITAAVFLLVVACSGLWLAYESLYFGFEMQNMAQRFKNSGPGGARPNGPGRNRTNPVEPLRDAQIPEMMRVTLDGEHKALHDDPIKVVRLRNFGNQAQGVVVAGEGYDTAQVVFDAATGRPMSETELSRPPAGIFTFPFGWDAHQTAKAVHRGSFFGLGARFLDYFAGLSLLYLCINGIALYIEMWQERRGVGNKRFFWV
jgi:uncharacterized iron-regulated membrane protein